MIDTQPLLIAALTGLCSGLVLSVPIGPVNLTIINEGARRGFRHAATVGLGGSVMDIIYCSIAFTGFANFFRNANVKTILEIVSALFIMGLGILFLRAKTIPSHGRVGERIEERFHPQSAFATGFVRVLGNPGILGGWIVLSGSILAQPSMPLKWACIIGIFTGTCTWFCILSYCASLGRKRINSQTLLWMERLSGLGLLLFGIAYGLRIAWEIARTQHLAG